MYILQENSKFYLHKTYNYSDVKGNIKKYIDCAKEVAMKSIFSHRLGSCLVSGTDIFIGENQHRQYYGRKFYKSLHAEMNSLRKKQSKLRKFCEKKINKKSNTIFIVRLMNNLNENKEFILGNSKPCKNCEINLYEGGIDRIYYTDNENGIQVIKELRIKN
jgi:deoxycytidylate deaminase